MDRSVKFRAAPQPRTAHEYVLDSLRTGILEGDLAPGTQLVQASVASQLGVSTTPVREALRDLAGEGLVRFDAHRGAVVNGVDLRQCREVYDLRMILEPHALRRSLPRLPSATIDEAATYHDAMRETEDPRDWAELNRSFHHLLTSGAESQQLDEILRRLQRASEAFVGISLRVAPGQMVHAHTEHGELLAAARERDVERAAHVIVAHLQGTLREIERTHQATDQAGSDGEDPDSGG